ncbi:MAG: helix-turn-helix transcriptional regulator [Planctomycetales bacterium]|nr:helix-turn-helix transcriptional regulator [Planctomycetales bacterium]
MLTESVVMAVTTLLVEGQLLQRQIARRTGVSRTTISNIANGRRGLWGRETPCGDAETHHLAIEAKAERCPGCGGLVYMPCVLCAVRSSPGRTEVCNVEIPSRAEMRLVRELIDESSRTGETC